MSRLLIIKNIQKSFLHSQEGFLFQDISLSIQKGEWMSIIGPSGAGKTTLLHCIAGIYPIDGGSIELDGVSIHGLSEREKSDLRRLKIGFVFQDFKLLPYYSVLENVILPLSKDQKTRDLKRKAAGLLKDVGIPESYYHRLPASLSGGEKQRIAIARALINDPKLIICDEPTGNLDNENKKQILQILTTLKQNGHAIIIVTHDEEVADAGTRTYELKDYSLREARLIG